MELGARLSSCVVTVLIGCGARPSVEHHDRPVARHDERSRVHATAGPLALGHGHACVVQPDRTVSCWGWNSSEKLGDDEKTYERLRPQGVAGLTQVASIAAGEHHTCALKLDSTIECWGSNSAGQLGNGTREDSRRAVAAIGVANAIDVAAGQNHTCALLRDGRVACWGWNIFGQLGIDEPQPEGDMNVGSTTAVVVAGIDRARQITAGLHHTCVLRDDESAVCFGRNDHGELGDGTTAHRSKPRPALDARAAAVFAAGHFTCVVTVAGETRCWGAKQWGQVLDGNEARETIVGGLSHACSRALNGEVECWGTNDQGQLGDRTRVDRERPMRVGGLENVAFIAAAGFSTCTVGYDGSVACWGSNHFGQLGDGTKVDRAWPTTIEGLTALAPEGAAHR